VAFAALCAGARVANADGFSQTNLVSDMPGLATTPGSSLVNPWGVSFANGESNLDFEPGHKYGPALSASGPQGPTGQVANALMLQTVDIATDRDPRPLQTNKRRI
jgi:hypothetical protein